MCNFEHGACATGIAVSAVYAVYVVWLGEGGSGSDERGPARTDADHDLLGLVQNVNAHTVRPAAGMAVKVGGC